MHRPIAAAVFCPPLLLAAPAQAGAAVENGAAAHVVIVHVLGRGDHPKPLLEGATGREAHPERFEIVERRLPRGRIGMDMRLVHLVDLLAGPDVISRKPGRWETLRLGPLPRPDWPARGRLPRRLSYVTIISASMI